MDSLTGNSIKIKQINRVAVLTALLKNSPAIVTQLSAEINLTAATITNILSEFVVEQIVSAITDFGGGILSCRITPFDARIGPVVALHQVGLVMEEMMTEQELPIESDFEISSWQECDLSERAIDGPHFGKEICFNLKPYEIKTFLLEFAATFKCEKN